MQTLAPIIHRNAMQADVLERMQFLTSISAETTATKNLENSCEQYSTQDSRTANNIAFACHDQPPFYFGNLTHGTHMYI